jgi:quercetin dioxygenase-like cupin family protein
VSNVNGKGTDMSKHRSFVPRVLLHGGQSDGAIAVVEVAVLPRWEGPPLHHHAFDEGFYVLDGELTFQLGEELRTGTPGAFAFARGGVVHTLANFADAPARYLLLITPAGFEGYFERAAAEAAGVEPPAWAREASPETTVVGPQIAVPAAPDAARPLPQAEARINVILRGAGSDGRVSVMDNHVRADGHGPPLHHHAFDEAFYVLDGELTFQLGTERVVRRRGELAFAPRGAHHTFANFGTVDGRTLIVCTPAGFERYFQRIAARNAGVEPPPEALEPWPEVVTVGPPLAGDG